MTETPGGGELAETLERAAEFDTWLPEALALQGPPLLFVLCLASCLALPVPASIAMLAAGAIAAEGGLSLHWLALAAFLGAITGDQIAYFIGRAGRGPLIRWIDRNPKRREARQKAEAWTERRAGPGVLLSRWPISPLGPYVNFAAGASNLTWRKFTAWGAPGEAVWVSVNLGFGYFFAGEINRLWMIGHETVVVVLALLALAALLIWRWRRAKRG